MSSVREDLDSFLQFAAEQMAAGESAASLDELFMRWQDRREREEINQAIRHGLADVNDGRYEPADRAMETIREEFGFAQE
jgi:hypothetical protein